MENVVELLDKYLEKVGMTAQQAWPYLVQYTYMRGLIWMAFSLVPFALGIMFLCIRKKAKSDNKTFALSIAIMWFMLAIVLVLENAINVFNPEAATVHYMIKELSGGK